MTPRELGATIVRRYGEFYGTDGPDITQSAIDLGKLDDLVRAVDALAGALLAALPDAAVEQARYRARRRTLRFYDSAGTSMAGCLRTPRSSDRAHG